jgi:signal transduction histidine kinase/CheY-like chemotaxis protein
VSVQPAESHPSGRQVLGAVLRRHFAATVAVLLTVAMTVVAALGARAVVRGQEHRLLHERAVELQLFLSSLVGSLQVNLRAAGVAALHDTAPSASFAVNAQAVVGTTSTLVVAKEVDGTFRVVISSPNKVAADTALTGTRDELARRAVRSPSAIVDGMVQDPSGMRVVLMVSLGETTPAVAYLDAPITPAQPAPTTKNSPYRDLNVQIYLSKVADPKTLVLGSGELAAKGTYKDIQHMPVGDDSWLIVTSARTPLVGSFAQAFPWLIVAGGALLTLLLAALAETLARRRSYALNLVEQRTKTLREAQLAAESANRSKSEFLSRMSHELRTPLNAVLGFGQLLEMDDLTIEQRQAVNHITRGGRHLLDLINEILDISHIEAGQLSLSLEPVLVSDVVDDIVELVRPLAADRSISVLSSEAERCQKYVQADRQRLKQILLNLLGNSIKYNRQGGSVLISCVSADEGQVRIVVTDTGPGIPEEKRDLLFTPFERLGAEQTSVEGTGIGLALSRRLAEAMDGTLDFESTPGRGSTFWVQFAEVEGPIERFERIEGSATRPVAPMHELSVLHIEDNQSNIQLVERILVQRPGVRLIPAVLGHLGLDLARDYRPTLILLDLNLPDMSGEEVLHGLQQDPRTANIPVVVVSADATPRQIRRLLTAGATAYLTKPIDVSELLRLIDRAVQRAGAETAPTS